jgi:hypothetical protein
MLETAWDAALGSLRAVVRCVGERLTDPDGLWPWVEDNQGLISSVAFAAALVVAVVEHLRAISARSDALLAEEKRRTAVEESRAEAEAQARTADINRRLAEVGSFATTARRFLLDARNALEDDMVAAGEMMVDGRHMNVPHDRVIRQAEGSIVTLNAMIVGAKLSPAIVVAARDGVSVLLDVAQTKEAWPDDYRDVYAKWIAALTAAQSGITDAEIELVNLLRPMPPYAVDDAFNPPEPGFGGGRGQI